MGEKAEKGAVFGGENGGMSIFELLWGGFFGQKLEKVGKNGSVLRAKNGRFLWFFNIQNLLSGLFES